MLEVLKKAVVTLLVFMFLMSTGDTVFTFAGGSRSTDCCTCCCSAGERPSSSHGTGCLMGKDPVCHPPLESAAVACKLQMPGCGGRTELPFIAAQKDLCRAPVLSEPTSYSLRSTYVCQDFPGMSSDHCDLIFHPPC